jgi:hypothetical protein
MDLLRGADVQISSRNYEVIVTTLSGSRSCSSPAASLALKQRDANV